MDLQSTPSLLTDAEVAARLNISRSMLHKLRSQGKVPQAVRLGRCLRWSAETIEAWIKAGCPHPDAWRADDNA